MARKSTRRLSYYCVGQQESQVGHSLGVNSFASDDVSVSSTGFAKLYSAGRDGLVCSWSVPAKDSKEHEIHDEDPFSDHNELNPKGRPRAGSTREDSNEDSSQFITSVALHSHWINDILLNRGNIISASSDLTVKLWNPRLNNISKIGQHQDYVKCLASPSSDSDWAVSGALDRKIKVWDMHQGAERAMFNLNENGDNDKGSVYSLGASQRIIASGSPDNIVRLWDERAGKEPINKFVGHTDNIRAILMSESGHVVLTGSSDSTIKLWSVTAGRLLHTFKMHDDAVWTLLSDHPGLEAFHSAGRSGLVTKTDFRGKNVSNAVSIALCNEHTGVYKLAKTADEVWVATSHSRIHGWNDFDTTNLLSKNSEEASIYSSPSKRRGSRPRSTSISDISGPSTESAPPYLVPSTNSQSALFSDNADTDSLSPTYDPEITPFHRDPKETLQGRDGLIKRTLLRDKRRVLTQSSSGEVVLWDILLAAPIKSFGIGIDIDSLVAEIDTSDFVANWCHVNIRTGQLCVLLEESYCFDAESYADNIDIPEISDRFQDDQRVNLGKIMIGSLLKNFVDEEVSRDYSYRQSLRSKDGKLKPSLSLSFSGLRNVSRSVPGTPTIQIATPAPSYNPFKGNNHASTVHTPEGTSSRTSMDKADYFGSVVDAAAVSLQKQQAGAHDGAHHGPFGNHRHSPSTSSIGALDTNTSTDHNGTAANHNHDALHDAGQTHSFMGKLRSFGRGKLSRTPTSESLNRPVPKSPQAQQQAPSLNPLVASPLQKVEEGRVQEDNIATVIRQIREHYEPKEEGGGANPKEDNLDTSALHLPPSSDIPILDLSPQTPIFITELRPDLGGQLDIYRGTVGTAGENASLLENCAPAWLGSYLLRNITPAKEIPKLSFILAPYHDDLPGFVNSESRLNAYRMLRARKILAYVDERLEDGIKPPSRIKGIQLEREYEREVERDTKNKVQTTRPRPVVMKPEDYLELICHGQVVPPKMTLATMRTKLWKSGGDILLYYRRRDMF